MRLLHLDSSINGDASASRAISAAVVERLVALDPTIEVARRDLVSAPVDHLLLATRVGDETNESLQEFLASDIIVIGTGLYNFTIPSQLKTWLDHILIAGQTFRYTAEGPQGLVGEKRAIIVLARGGVYSEGSPYAPFEHGETLLRTLLGFMGISNPEFIVAEGLAVSEEMRQASLDSALQKAREVQLNVSEKAA